MTAPAQDDEEGRSAQHGLSEVERAAACGHSINRYGCCEHLRRGSAVSDLACYVCLLNGSTTPAVTLIGGTAVCGDHVHWIANGSILALNPRPGSR